MTRHAASLALFLAAGCAAATVGPLTIGLQYRMTADPVEFPLLQACAAVSAVEASDARSNPHLGTRFLEKQPDATHPVTSSSDVAGWARVGVEDALRRARVEVGRPSAPVLRFAVEEVTTAETVFRRAEYDGRVVLRAELRRTSAEPACWQERVDGFAENYGYPGSHENYQETLNHALDRAVIRMLNSNGFKEAVCSCTPKGGV